ncbi:hypothetical protein [Azospirillum sp. TSO35-2]|uniref:hypothetical protein n=1 Tax=Azospirillum sp. TSO35-2 TaxID=716796 RepID=UPI000D644A50|nr:hypothetical protein [Azospirillum sp. TSO35-2]
MKALIAATLSAVTLGAGLALLARRAERRPGGRPGVTELAAEADAVEPDAAKLEAVDRAMRDVVAYAVLPVGALAGVADWACHHATDIEHRTGPQESLYHLTMLGQGAVPGLALLFLEINPPVLALMTAGFVTHQATMLLDLRYSAPRREITPVEQSIHTLQTLVPGIPLAMALARHWATPEDRREGRGFRLRRGIAPGHVAIAAAASLLDGLVYSTELLAGFRGAAEVRDGRRP